MFSARAGRVSSSSPREPSQMGWITLRTLQELEEADERLNNNIGDSGRVGRHRRAQRARPTTASVAVEPAPVPRNGGDVGGATSGALPTSERAGSSRLVPKGVAPVEEGASDQAVPLLKRMRPDELRKLSKAAAALEKTPSSRTAKKVRSLELEVPMHGASEGALGVRVFQDVPHRRREGFNRDEKRTDADDCSSNSDTESGEDSSSSDGM